MFVSILYEASIISDFQPFYAFSAGVPDAFLSCGLFVHYLLTRWKDYLKELCGESFHKKQRMFKTC